MSSEFYFNQLLKTKKNCKKIFETKYYIILLLRFHKLLIFLDSFQFQKSGNAASFYHVNIDVSVEYTQLTSDNQHHTKNSQFSYFFLPFLCSLFVIIKTYLSFRSNITSLVSVFKPNRKINFEMRIFLSSTSSSSWKNGCTAFFF